MCMQECVCVCVLCVCVWYASIYRTFISRIYKKTETLVVTSQNGNWVVAGKEESKEGFLILYSFIHFAILMMQIYYPTIKINQ